MEMFEEKEWLLHVQRQQNMVNRAIQYKVLELDSSPGPGFSKHDWAHPRLGKNIHAFFTPQNESLSIKIRLSWHSLGLGRKLAWASFLVGLGSKPCGLLARRSRERIPLILSSFEKPRPSLFPFACRLLAHKCRRKPHWRFYWSGCETPGPGERLGSAPALTVCRALHTG